MAIQIVRREGTSCIKCQIIPTYYYSVGPFNMCRSCFKEEFPTLYIKRDPFISIGNAEHDTYKKWLKKYLEDN